jgi:hypothetical protein
MKRRTKKESRVNKRRKNKNKEMEKDAENNKKVKQDKFKMN